MAALPNLSADQIFANKYRVVRLIKSGGMGAVYEVRHTVNDKRWALKIMKPELAGDPEARERFEREAKIDSLIESTFVVSVIDAGIDEATETPYLVMEYLVGEELGARSKRVGPMAPADVVRLLAQVARALDKAHDRKIIHRDLKPDNLFIASDDEGEGEKIRILDFGIAKILEGAGEAQSSTHAGGTPMYMAPEQTRRTREIGPWTDVWALGLIVYTLLVGRPYWEGEALGEVIREIIDTLPREAPSARSRRSGVELPPAFDAWFLRCIESEPQKRFARAGEAIARLGDVFGVTVSQAPLTPSPLAETVPADAIPTPVLSPAPPLKPAIAEPQQPRSSKSKTLPALAIVAGALVAMFVVVKVLSLGVGPTVGGTSSPTIASSTVNDLRATIERDNPFLRAGASAVIALQKTEVTRGQYSTYVASLADAASKARARPLRDWPGDPSNASQPVTWVTRARATHFCEAIGARLPTIAEWKLAASSRGGAYPWGAAWPPQRLADIAVAQPRRQTPLDVMSAPVDRTLADHFDLFGNVSEWTSTSEKGLATVAGAPIDVGLTEAREMFVAGVQKIDDEGTGPGPEEDARAEELADALVGFRCARAL